ncbi:hypothetical protein BpHYR1_004216 [Brachionus plicatilis]|uniref:Uncharacterized protein n=1 Tax=Brachionus plicatilis TaxID=10195 RepID=A0A3M7P6B2_BRAPC|nr:hypothetical protein BpHYR1_004216 [Brachionus plicatilis]
MRKLTMVQKKTQDLIVGTNNVKMKSNHVQIAGLVSPLVGSSTEYPLLKILFSSKKENKLDYLCLDECQSGVDDMNSSSLNDLRLFENENPKKINYVPLEVVNSRNDVNIILDSTSQLSNSSSFINDHKIYDLDLNKSFTLSKKSNVSNATNSDVPYSYLDAKKTEALKSTIREFKKQF